MKISKVKSRNLYSANVRKPDGGYKKVYGKTKKEVREKAESLTFDIKSGKFVEDNRITFSDWNNEWLKNYLIDVSDSTIASYTGMVKNHINPHFKNKKIQNISHHDIQVFINQLTKTLSPKTIRNIHLVIHRSLRDAKLNGFIAANPADDIILPRLEKKEMNVLDQAEISEFLSVAYDLSPYADCFEFLILTGLRIGEFIGLTVDSYKPETGELLINKQWSRKFHKFMPPKHGVTRSILLNTKAREIIEKHIKESVEMEKVFGDLNPDHMIFLNSNYSIHSDFNLRKHFKKIVNELGKPDMRVHDLRHTHVTLSLLYGIDLKTVSQNVGHSTPDFTLNKYAHRTKTMQEYANETWDKNYKGIDT